MPSAHNCNRAMHESRAVHCAFPSLQKPGCSPTEPQRYRFWTLAHSQPQIKLIKQNNNGRTKQGARGSAECFGRINTKVITVSHKCTPLLRGKSVHCRFSISKNGTYYTKLNEQYSKQMNVLIRIIDNGKINIILGKLRTIFSLRCNVTVAKAIWLQKRFTAILSLHRMLINFKLR